MKIDLGRLAVIEQTRDADRGAWQEADQACRRIAGDNAQLVREKQSLEQTPRTADSETMKKRYESLQSLQRRIEANSKRHADLKIVRDLADEKMRASQQLWDSCAKLAGIR